MGGLGWKTYKLRHNLLNQVSEDNGYHKDGKHLVLKALNRVVGLVERKSNEE